MRHEPKIRAAQVAPGQPLNPAWDVAKIATRGHVLTARIEYASKRFSMPLIGVGVILVGLAVGVVGPAPSYMSEGFGGGIVGTLRQALTYDPSTYFDLGGGLRGGPQEAWIGKYAPTPESLTQGQLDDMVQAVATDLRTHGRDAASWQAVAALKKQPTITRPEKVFADHAGDLAHGVVSLPASGGYVSMLAYVGGQWSLTAFGGGCYTLVGPVAKGCQDSTRNSNGGISADAMMFFNSFKKG